MATANVQIKTITPEEAHYESAERMQDEIREIAVDQKRNFNEIKNDVSSIYDISIGAAITSILTILIIGIILINKVKKYFEQTKSILKKQEEEIAKLKQSIDQNQEAEIPKEDLSESEKEIINIIKNNPEKAEMIAKLLK